VIEALNWIKLNIDKENTILVLHEAMYNWARIVARDINSIRIKEIELSSQIRENIEKILIRLSEENMKNGKKVYTIW